MNCILLLLDFNCYFLFKLCQVHSRDFPFLSIYLLNGVEGVKGIISTDRFNSSSSLPPNSNNLQPSIPSHARSTSLASSGLSRALPKSISLLAPYSLASKTDFSIWSALMPMGCLLYKQIT